MMIQTRICVCLGRANALVALSRGFLLVFLASRSTRTIAGCMTSRDLIRRAKSTLADSVRRDNGARNGILESLVSGSGKRTRRVSEVKSRSLSSNSAIGTLDTSIGSEPANGITEPASGDISFSSVTDTRKTLHNIRSLVDNGQQWNHFLRKVENTKKQSAYTIAEVELVWTNLIDLFSAEPSRDRLNKLCQLWVVGTSPGGVRDNTEFQNIFIGKWLVFINILINTRSYPIYTKYVEPLYSDSRYLKLVLRSWVDEVITTLKFELNSDEKLTYSDHTIRSYITNKNNTIEHKRLMLATFVRKGILYSSNTEERLAVIGAFLGYLRFIEDDHLLFLDYKYRHYWKAIATIARPPQDTAAYNYAHHLSVVFGRIFGDDNTSFYNFLTLAINSIQKHSPATTLNYWDYKLELVYSEMPQQRGPNTEDETIKGAFHHRDLTNAMKALRAQNLYNEVFELHTNFPELHHDEQIDTLLYTCEDSKDWMMLQNHFESMYGKGDLPLPIHYAIVMNALASIGATSDVERLFSQLVKRKLMPTAYVYAALIKCRIHDGDIDDAIRVAESYFQLLDKGKVSDKPTTYLYNVILKAYTRSSDLPLAMKFLRRVVNLQLQMQTTLINYLLLGDFIRFASKNLGINEMQEIVDIASQLGADGVTFRLQLAKAYTAMGLYERAETETFRAHSISLVPFNMPHVYATQVRNYFYWYQMAQTTENKRYLVSRIKFIVSRLYDGSLEKSGRGHLIAELIRYYVHRGPLRNARSLLELAKAQEVLHETHYLPLLKYYSSQDDIQSHQEVLALYKDMAVNRIHAGAKTYVSLMKALIYLDSRTGNYDRSYELLRTIFDTHGLSINSPKVKEVVSFEAIFNDASELCSIVSQYVMAKQPSPNELLLNFLEQMKQILDSRLTNDFRFLIAYDMARLYSQQGNVSFAMALAKNTVSEINEMLDKYWKAYTANGYPLSQFRYPKSLILIYQRLMRILFANSTSEEIVGLYFEAEKHNVILLGNQYNTVIRCLLEGHLKSSTRLETALSISERHLVSGNWMERTLYERLQSYWKLFMLSELQTKGSSASTMAKYKLLNDFYDVKHPKPLARELKHIKHPLEKLHKLVERNGVPYKKNLKVVGLLKLIPQVFNPEYKIFSENKVHPQNINLIRKTVNKYIGKNEAKAYHLMDDYESTLMFLMDEQDMAHKIWKFRQEINRILKPQTPHESLDQRRKRTIQALSLAHQDQPPKAFL